MTTEEMKELYATGEWICLSKMHYDDTWVKRTDPSFHKAMEYKLIHKKHSEVLAHVLNGGKAKLKEACHKHWLLMAYSHIDFFATYCDKCIYETIKDKPSLNGHYCLATKEHYDKLIEDGYAYFESYCDTTYYSIEGQTFQNFSLETKDITPMHLHNNQWVFGSLEYESVFDKADKEEFQFMIDNENPKPMVERITMTKDQIIDACAFDKPNQIIAYVEYLEANQKET